MLLVCFLLQANCQELISAIWDKQNDYNELPAKMGEVNLSSALHDLFHLYQDRKDRYTPNWYIIFRRVTDLKKSIYHFLLQFDLFREKNRGKNLSFFIEQFDAIAQQYGGESFFKVVNLLEYFNLYSKGLILTPLPGKTIDELYREVERNFGRYLYLENNLLSRGFIPDSKYLRKMKRGIKGKVGELLFAYLNIFFKGEYIREDKKSSSIFQIKSKLDEIIYPFLTQVHKWADLFAIEVEEKISLYALINLRENIRFFITLSRSSVAHSIQEYSLSFNQDQMLLMHERNDNISKEEVNNIFSLIGDMRSMSVVQRREFISFLQHEKDFYTQLIANIYQKNRSLKSTDILLDERFLLDGRREVPAGNHSFMQGKFIFELFYLYNIALAYAQLDESKSWQIFENFLESYHPLALVTNVTQYRWRSFNFNSFLYENLVLRLQEIIYAKPYQRSQLVENLKKIDRDLQAIIFQLFTRNRAALSAASPLDFFLEHSFDLLSGELSPKGVKGKRLSNLLQMNLYAQRWMVGDNLIVPPDDQEKRRGASFFTGLDQNLVLRTLLEYFKQADPMDLNAFPSLGEIENRRILF